MEETKETMQAEEVLQPQKTGEQEVLSEAAATKSVVNKKAILIIFLTLLILTIIGAAVALIMSYRKKVAYYTTHYLPNTYINEVNCSELEAFQVAEILDARAREYSLLLTGRDEAGNSVELGVIQADAINLSLTDALGAANDILAAQDETHWYEATEDVRYSYSVVQGVKFDEELLKNAVENIDACQKKNMIAPTDAYIGDFSEEKGIYEIVPETRGTRLDMDAVMDSVTAAIYGNAVTVDLQEHGCYLEPAVTKDAEELVSVADTINKWLGTEVTYDWNASEVLVDTSVIKEWVSIEGGEPVLDEEAVAAFVAENAAKYDTYRKNRKFVTTHGVELNLPSGAFGWKTDEENETKELIALIKEGSVSEREPVYSHKAPRKGTNDIGNSYVEADLGRQHLYLYYKGNLVHECDFVSGESNVPGNRTPQGVFGITYKTTNAILRGADYETPVTYWMPFHGNFGMHDATWRTEFGGDIYTYNGSHGCLNLPLESAAVIYSYMYEGYPVICYY